MNKLNSTIITAVLAGFTGVAIAAGPVINDDLTRRPAGSTSGSGDTVEANCGGPDYQDATGSLSIEHTADGNSKVQVQINDGVPNTHYTVWMRIKGGAGFNSAGSPWTTGGATPLCSGTEFATLNANSPWNSTGSTAPLCNSIITNNVGNGKLRTVVNFPVVGGAYPFQQSGGPSTHVPTAIVDPRTGNGGPFLIRVISHCTDNSTHGLSPATREAWFQYP